MIPRFAAMLPLALGLALPAQADTCPDFTLNGVEFTRSADDLWTPEVLDVLAGGSVNLAQCPTLPGIGHVGLGPDFTLRYDGTPGMALTMTVNSACDTVLLVNTPTMDWAFDDDSAGDLNPGLWFADAESGLYDIWVGTIGDALCEAELTLETFGSG